MNEKNIQMKSYWNVSWENKYIEQNSEILGIILPGQNYTNENPLMYYSDKIALEAGLDVLCIDYGFQISHKDFNVETEFDILVREVEQIAKDCVNKKYKKIVFIGKSMGTIIQNRLSKIFIDFEQLHIYLTPVDKTFEYMVNYPCLVITGTDDRKINNLNMSIIKNSKNIELIKIDGGNHRLECLEVSKSIEMLETTMASLKSFIIKHTKG
jgi:hypothetical protein